MKVALDIQHLYKASHPKDRGCFGSGVYEADIVKDYMSKTAFLLQEKGIDVIINETERSPLTGDYWQRHAYANNNNVHLYIAGHLNVDSTQPEYVFIEHKTPANYFAVIFSHILSAHLKNYLNTDNVVIKPIKEDNPDYFCINNLIMPAVIIKPLSLHNKSHMELVKDQGLFVIAEAIRNAIDQYRETDLGI